MHSAHAQKLHLTPPQFLWEVVAIYNLDGYATQLHMRDANLYFGCSNPANE